MSGARRAHRVGGADTIVVFAFDSVSGTPLQGATVLVSPSGAMALTDSAGLATLITPDPRRLVLYHDALEETGVGPLSAARDPADSTLRWNVQFSTPSLATLRARLCGTSLADPALDRIVYGVVRRLHGDPVEEATIVVQWDTSARPPHRPTGDTSHREQPTPAVVTRRLRTGANGVYAVCDVPSQHGIALVGSVVDAISGNVFLPAGGSRVVRQDLQLAPRALQEPTGEVRGVVADAEGKAVIGATVWIDGLEQEATTDHTGLFSFLAVPGGTRTIGFRRIGYAAASRSVDVSVRTPTVVHLSATRTSVLEAMDIRTTFGSRDRREFEARRLAGQSQIIDAQELSKYSELRSVMFQLRGTQVQANSRGDWTLLGRIRKTGRCNVHIFFDGVLLWNTDKIPTAPFELLRTIQPADLAAAEYFSSDAHAPARYRSLSDGCGVLLLWTKAAFLQPLNYF